MKTQFFMKNGGVLRRQELAPKATHHTNDQRAKLAERS